MGDRHNDLNGAYYGPSIPPPRKVSHSHGRGGGGCCGCIGDCLGCCGCCILSVIFNILITIAIILGIAALIIWLIFRPNAIKFHVADAKLTQFTLGADNNLQYNLDLNFTIRNPNRRIGVYYDQIEVRGYYGDQRFGNGNVAPFYQGHKNTTEVGSKLSGQSLVLLNGGDRKNLDEDLKSAPTLADKPPSSESESFSFPTLNISSIGTHPQNIEDGIPRLSRDLSQKSRSTKSRQAAVAKVSEVSSLLGRAGTMGLGKAVDVLDTLGSSMTNLNLNAGFSSATTIKGNKISILSFEVANTIVKGANLMHSLSNDSITHLKDSVLPSEGVQNLISKDMDELLRIAAADKREELKIFSGEVVRFGNRCKDPQYHNLDRFFDRLASEFTPQKQLKQEAETIMHQLMTFVHFTADLYHELHALDRFEQDYQRKIQEEENPSTVQRGVGDTLAILRTELKSQKKHVRNLKKKSLWSRILEEVMEKLVDVVHFLHLEIHQAFGGADADKPANDPPINHKKLGSAGLALHYANIITQIDTLVSRSSTMPSSTRDALYQGLPPSIKSALRSRIQSFQVKEELTVPQIKAEMEKTLQWLVPVATNTTKAHHGFGWVGEWASSGSDGNQRPAGQTILRIDTLHHADKEKTEAYILDLVVWLHHLVTQVRATTGFGLRSPVKSPIRSPNQKTIQLSSGNPSMGSPLLTMEDQEMLRDVSKRRKTPGISKSQEFQTVAKARLCKHHRLSKSSSHSPMMGEMMKSKKDAFAMRRPSSVPIIDFEIDRMKALDVIDRVDTIRSL